MFELLADVVVWLWTYVTSGTPVFDLFADIVAWFWTYVPSGTYVYVLLSRKKKDRCKVEKCLACLLVSVCGVVRLCQGRPEKTNF